VPLYEFECPRCGARFEELVRVGGVAPCACCEEMRRAEREARRVERFAEQRSRRRAGGGELSGGPS